MPSRRRHLTPTWAIAALLAILYGPLLVHWVDGWLHKSISIQHEYFSHGLLGLPFAAYLTWGKRPAWGSLPNRCHPLGLGLVGLGVLMYLTRLPDWMNLSLPVMLVGLCLSLKSVAGLRLQAISLILVALATPNQLPYLIEPYILPLQQLIASVAGFLLVQLGVPVTVESIYLYVNGQTVEVAPHCAGLKMMFTSLYVALMLAYWTGAYRSRLHSGLFVAGTVLISVAGNILRNTLLSYFHGMGHTGAFAWLHESWGGDLYSALMLLTIILLLRLIQNRVPPSLDLTVQPAAPSQSV
ncbi:MAG: cyanoexosortase B [Shackletoniella antarctica]|uniref:Cyanoexosortase B n=1 Tax=Shackletoniella antarctica TaxID=268115 RepID=A0A2W4W988_9CYAN|nr:MAG: cyanoexosortase B [Shackletoniella antarctica]